MSIEVAHVEVGEEERQLLDAALSSGNLAQGQLVARLEAEFAERSGARFAVATSSGTTALQLALEVAGVGPGDEVITSPFTFVATLNAILGRGAIAHLVDIDPDTFNLSPDLARAAVNARTKAAVPVHLYGLPADMDSFSQLGREAGIRIVEDAAQAHLSTRSGYRVGTFDLACFSLYATKNMTSGEGGMVTGSNPDDEAMLRVLRNQGMRGRYEYVAIGYNYRLTDIAAAIGLGQMHRLTATMSRRARNAEYLTAGLKGVPGLVPPVVPPECLHAWHQYTVRITDEACLNRDQLAESLRSLGIGSGVYYPRVLTDYPPFAEHPKVVSADIPEARRAARQVLSLPVHAHLSESDLARIVSAVRTSLEAP